MPPRKKAAVATDATLDQLKQKRDELQKALTEIEDQIFTSSHEEARRKIEEQVEIARKALTEAVRISDEECVSFEFDFDYELSGYYNNNHGWSSSHC